MEDALIASALQHDVDPNIRRVASLGPPLTLYTPKTHTSNLDSYFRQLETKHLASNLLTNLIQSSFQGGTYRITKPGIYRLQENIVFNPQPNYQMFPTDQQLQDTYPGRPGPYSLGFFAAITIESKDVILDLGGYGIKQSVEFYILQRFFSVIELGNSPFIPKQGPGKFGSQFIGTDYVWIKNGTLGLSSHHGIHGNQAKNLLVSDVTVTNFEAGGIALNQAQHVTLRNVRVLNSIGTILKVPVNARFSATMFLWRRFRSLISQTVNDPKTNNYSFRFGEYQFTLSEMFQILNNLVESTVSTILSQGISKPVRLVGRSWKYFNNPTGIPDGSAMYGIIINKLGVAVNEFGSCASECHNPNVSKGILIENVSINNLVLNPLEVVVLLDETGNHLKDFGGSVIMVSKCPWWEKPSTYSTQSFIPTATFIQTYQGSLVYDEILLAQVMLHHYAQTIGPKSVAVVSNISNAVISWVQDGYKPFESYGSYQTMRNADIMSHVMKGVVGLRIDFANQVTIQGVQISNLSNMGEPGIQTTKLSGYLDGSATNSSNHLGHIKSDDLDIGYTGNRCRGISAINTVDLLVSQLKLQTIMSKTGNACGIDLLKNNSKTGLQDIKVHTIMAGFSKTNELTVPYRVRNELPNLCPESVGIYLREANSAIQLGRVKISGVCATGYYATLSCKCELDISNMNVTKQYHPVNITYQLSSGSAGNGASDTLE